MVCRSSRGVTVEGMPASKWLDWLLKKCGQAREIPPSTLVLVGDEIVLLSLDIHAEFQGVGSMRPERIVSNLIIVERVDVIRGRSDAALISLKAAIDLNGGRGLTGRAAQRR